MDWIPCDTGEAIPPKPAPVPEKRGVRIVHSTGKQNKKARAPRGNTERLEKIRRRKRLRRLRFAMAAVLLLAGLLAGFAGVYGASLTLLGDWIDAAVIALSPGRYPVPFTLSGFREALPLSGGFAAVGQQDLVLYAAGGEELRRIQHGYARADITAGNTRVCIYNRTGRNLRVESRSRTLFEHTFDNAIQLCAMSPNGTLAVFTRSLLTVYDPLFEEIYSFRTQELPTAMAFCSDNRHLAAACVRAEGGALGGILYLMDTERDEYVTVTSTEGLPLQMQYLSRGKLLVVYDTFAAVYKTEDGAELFRYSYDGRTLQSAAFGGNGQTALLFGDGAQGANAQLVLLDDELAVTASTAAGARTLSVAVGRSGVYVLRYDSVLCCSAEGVPEHTVITQSRPLAVLGHGAKPLLLTQGQAGYLDTQPAETE